MNKKKTPEEVQSETNQLHEELINILKKYDFFIGITVLQILLIESFDGHKEKFLQIIELAWESWKNENSSN